MITREYQGPLRLVTFENQGFQRYCDLHLTEVTQVSKKKN